MSVLDQVPGVQLIFSTRMLSQYAIDVEERVNVISDEDELQALMAEDSKKVGCTWCSRCSFFRANHYHSADCRSSNPEGHRSDCEVHCRELLPIEVVDSEDNEKRSDTELEHDIKSAADTLHDNSIGLSPDVAKLLFGLSGTMLDPMGARFAMKVRFTKSSIRLKFYRQIPELDKTIRSHEYELQQLRDKKEYQLMTAEDKLKYKQLRKQLKKERRLEKKQLKKELDEELKRHMEEIKKLKNELDPKSKTKLKSESKTKSRKKLGLFRKKSGKIKDEDSVEVGYPELIDTSSSQIHRLSIKPASGELDKLISTSKVVIDSSSSTESDTDSGSIQESSENESRLNSEEEEYVNVKSLDCIERLKNRRDQLDQKKVKNST